MPRLMRYGSGLVGVAIAGLATTALAQPVAPAATEPTDSPAGDARPAPSEPPTVGAPPAEDGRGDPASDSAVGDGAVDPPPAGGEALPTATAEVEATDAEAEATDAEADPSDEEVGAILSELDEASVVAEALEPQLMSIYGFADFTVERIWQDSPGTGLWPATTFYVGNLNVYLDAQLHEDWRALSEVRFSYLPHGSVDLTTGQAVNTAALDYSDNYGEIQTGSIEIERVWLDYAPFSWLGVRIGQWLTPYGIWNVDHGSPTLIGIQKPYLTASQFLPERQTGFMLHGSFPLGSTVDLRLRATLSNGRGGVDAYRDLDSNKALGARAEIQRYGDLDVKVGASMYRGRYTTSDVGVVLQNGSVNLDLEPVVQYDELSLAGDVRLKVADLEVLGEVAVNEQAYVDGLRPNGLVGLSPNPQADIRRWGAYGLAGYTIDAIYLMPFIGYDHIFDPLRIGRINLYKAGLRFTPIASVTLKAEYTHAVPVSGLAGNETIRAMRFQAAWAFR